MAKKEIENKKDQVQEKTEKTVKKSSYSKKKKIKKNILNGVCSLIDLNFRLLL